MKHGEESTTAAVFSNEGDGLRLNGDTNEQDHILRLCESFSPIEYSLGEGEGSSRGWLRLGNQTDRILVVRWPACGQYE